MKKLILTGLFAASIGMVGAQTFPEPSPKASTSQTVGLTEIEIEYSRPGIKDRTIFGELVPYGKIWRTGANAATKITFSTDVNIDGNPVKAGEYSIFTIPEEDAVTVMFNSDAKASVGKYDESLDVAKVKVPFERAERVERLRFSIENVEDASADIVMSWAGKSFSVPVTVDTDKLVEQRMEEKLKEGEQPFNFYNAAAGYLMDKDPARAVEMAKKSTDMQPYFWNVTTLARAHAAAGNKDAAKKAADWGIKLAKESGAEYYVRLNEEIKAGL